MPGLYLTLTDTGDDNETRPSQRPAHQALQVFGTKQSRWWSHLSSVLGTTTMFILHPWGSTGGLRSHLAQRMEPYLQNIANATRTIVKPGDVSLKAVQNHVHRMLLANDVRNATPRRGNCGRKYTQRRERSLPAVSPLDSSTSFRWQAL